jgi:hypothetical protein
MFLFYFQPKCVLFNTGVFNFDFIGCLFRSKPRFELMGASASVCELRVRPELDVVQESLQ